MKQKVLKRVVVILMFGILLLDLQAQNAREGDLLRQFKYRTNGYRALTFYGDFGNLVSDSKVADSSKSAGLGAGLTGESRYMQSKSKDDKQRLVLAYASLSPFTYRKDNNAGARSANKSSNITLDWYDFTRVFRDKYFFEYGTGASFSGLTGSETNAAIENKIRTSTLNANLTAGVGKGRLEHISDMQTALFILQDLKEAGKLKSLDPGIADKFGHLITELRNGRVFDLRKRTRYQVKQMDQFLRENGVIEATDADEIGIINDNMYFSFNNDLSTLPVGIHQGVEGGTRPGNISPASFYDYIPLRQADLFNSGGDLTIFPDYITEFNVHTLQPLNEQTMRLSGQRIYLRSRGSYIRAINKSTQQQGVATVTASGLVTQAGLEKHKPISLQWHEVTSCNINYYFARNTNQSVLRFFQDQILDFNTSTLLSRISSLYFTSSYSRRYYPNGRSSIEGTATLNLFFSTLRGDGTGGNPLKARASGGNLETSLLATYFLNNNTVIRGEFNLFYRRFSRKEQNSLNDRSIQSFLGVSLLHTFF